MSLRTRSRRSSSSPRRFRYLPEASSDVELMQRFAGLTAETRSILGLNRYDRGVFPWMRLREAENDLEMVDALGFPRRPYRRSFIELRWLRPDRGDKPMLCPEGSLCNDCQSAPAEIAIFGAGEYSFSYVCRGCLNAGIERTRRRFS